MNNLLVETSDGFVRGIEVSVNKNFKFTSFLGIPYAKPPVGRLRFQPPQPIEPWEGIRDAFEAGADCCQTHFATNEFFGSEDCLYLNVFTPHLQSQIHLPVIVTINGSGLARGSGSPGFFKQDFFMKENTLVVSYNFRLGPFGFLSTSEPNAPGNVGIKDVLMALRWTKKNIRNFGGDPDNITIMGSSGGALIVNYLLFSTLCKGLFHKCIMQSGTALSPYAFTAEPLNTTKAFANILGFTGKDTTEMIDFLKTVPAEKLVEKYQVMKEKRIDKYFIDPFMPCVENEFEGQEAFLLKSPEKIIRNNEYLDVPIIIGFNQDEGVKFLLLHEFGLSKSEIYESIRKFVSKALEIKADAPENITEKFSSFYFDDCLPRDENLKNFADLLSDFIVIESISRFVKLHVSRKKRCPLYYYKFNYVGPFTRYTKAFLYNTSAVSHHDELPYLFKCYWTTDLSETDESKVVRKRMVRMWTNFAKYGNPTPHTDEIIFHKWAPVTDLEHMKYLDITSTLEMDVNPFHERMLFWEIIRKEIVVARGQNYIDYLQHFDSLEDF